MCRLLGIVANKPVDLEFSLVAGSETLKILSERNPDGWGIAWYKNGLPHPEKEPFPAYRSERYFAVAHSIHTPLAIAHVRYATTGNLTMANTHPFVWQEWAFAHNGSVDRAPILDRLAGAHKAALEGETDSEALFHWILQCIEQADDVPTGIRNAVGVARELKHSGLNFLLTDGHALYAMREASRNEDYYSLYSLSRNPAVAAPMTLKSSETGLLLQTKSLHGERAVLVCSERLTKSEEWQPVPLGHLLTVSSNLQTSLEKVVCR